MVYVRRSVSGEILAISKELPVGEQADAWSALAADDPELRAFGVQLLGRAGGLAAADLDFIRVLEDLIDLLQDKGVIAFTDLPASAQQKLFGRRQARASMRGLKLINDGEDEGIPLLL